MGIHDGIFDQALIIMQRILEPDSLLKVLKRPQLYFRQQALPESVL